MDKATTELVMPVWRQWALAAAWTFPCLMTALMLFALTPYQPHIELMLVPSQLGMFIVMIMTRHRPVRATAGAAGLTLREGKKVKRVTWHRLVALEVRGDGLFGRSSGGWQRLGGRPADSEAFMKIARAYLDARPPADPDDPHYHEIDALRHQHAAHSASVSA